MQLHWLVLTFCFYLTSTMSSFPTVETILSDFDSETLTNLISTNCQPSALVSEPDNERTARMKTLASSFYQLSLGVFEHVKLSPIREIKLLGITHASKLLNYAKSLWFTNTFQLISATNSSIGDVNTQLEKYRWEMVQSFDGRNLTFEPQMMVSVVNITRDDKTLLNALRDDVDEQLTRINGLPPSADRDALVQSLYLHTTDRMKLFLAQLYRECESLLNIPPPCTYAIFAVGSMALNQMTAYSDFEFGILTENDDYKSNPVTVNYFRDLTHLVHLRIINLGETVINEKDIGGAQIYHLIPRGVILDLGGKTPLMTDSTKPELIQTVEGFMKIVRNERKNGAWVDTSYILEATCFVHGDELLHTQFRSLVHEFLQSDAGALYPGLKNHHVRALKRLEEGVNDQNSLYNQGNPGGTGNLNQFAPRLTSLASEGRTFNVKQEIYRLPDRLIYNLALLFGVQSCSAWEAIDALVKLDAIGVVAAQHLRQAVSFATLLRARTYSVHKCQCDDLDIFETAGGVTSLSEHNLSSDGELFQYFFTVLALHAELETLLELFAVPDNRTAKNLQSSLADTYLFNSRAVTKGLICLRLARYTQSEGFFKTALGDMQHVSDHLDRATEFIKIQKELGRIYALQGRHQEALASYQAIIDKVLELRGVTIDAISFEDYPCDLDIAGALSNMGLIHKAGGDFALAVKCMKQAYIFSLQLHYNPAAEPEKRHDHTDTAGYLTNLAIAYHGMGQYDHAIETFEISLTMNSRLNTHKQYDYVIASLKSNLASSYKAKGKLQKAIELYDESLRMHVAFYGRFHDEVFRTKNNIGLILQEAKQYEQAVGLYAENLREQNIYFRGAKNPLIIATLNNLANACKFATAYEQAIQYYLEGYEAQMVVYNGADHEDTIITLGNLGSLYRTMGQPVDALRHYKLSLEMAERFYQKIKMHPEWARSLSGCGHVYRVMNQFEISRDYFTRSLSMFRAMHFIEQKQMVEDHIDLADCLGNLAMVQSELQQHEIAIKHYEDSVAMKVRILQTDFPKMAMADVELHPILGNTYLNLANAYYAADNLPKAIEYHLKCFEVKKKEYGDVDHADLARSLNSIGVIYRRNGDFLLALQYFGDGLEMRRRLYARRPASDTKQLEVASSLHNLAGAYLSMNDVAAAIRLFRECETVQLAVSSNLPQYYTQMSLTQDTMAQAYAQLEDAHSALACYVVGLKFKRLAYSSNINADIVNSLINIGRIQKRIGDVDGALQSSQEACQIIKDMGDPNNDFELATNLSDAIELYFAKQDFDGALKQCEAVLILCEGREEEHFTALQRHTRNTRGDVHRNLAAIANDNGDIKQSIQEYELSLMDTPDDCVDVRASVNHNLACMHHVLAVQTE